MDDILIDSEHSERTKSATFAKLAFGCGILTLTLFAILFINSLHLFRSLLGHPIVARMVSFTTLLSLVLGLIFSIISLVRKEQLKYLKAIAVTLNIGLFVLMIGSMIFALVMDIKRMS